MQKRTEFKKSLHDAINKYTTYIIRSYEINDVNKVDMYKEIVNDLKQLDKICEERNRY